MDIYAQYEIGLNALLRHMSPAHPRYEEVLDYQQQLKANLTNLRRYDDDDQGERLWIVEQLDELARDVSGRSFHELCTQRPSTQVPEEHYLMIGVFASLVVAASVVGLVQFWQGHHTTLSTLLLGGGVLAGWLGYLYVAFRERDTGALREAPAYEDELPGAGRSVRVKVAYYPVWLRRGALLGVLLISALTLVVIR
jgi:hypothetical protein